MSKELVELQAKFGNKNVKLKHFNGVVVRQNGKLANGRTVAVIRDGDTCHVGFSECSRKDVFSRAKGRLIALRRAEKQVTRGNDNCYAFTFDINNTENLPIDVPPHLYLNLKKESNNVPEAEAQA